MAPAARLERAVSTQCMESGIWRDYKRINSESKTCPRSGPASCRAPAHRARAECLHCERQQGPEALAALTCVGGVGVGGGVGDSLCTPRVLQL